MRPKRYEKELFPKRSRLLLYLRDKDLLDIFNIFSKRSKLTLTYLQKELGYNSPSHVYQDLLDLQELGYIEYDQTRDIIGITERGKQLTSIYGRFRALVLVLTIFGIGFFPILFYMSEWVLTYSMLLSVISVSCGISLLLNFWKLIKEKTIF